MVAVQDGDGGTAGPSASEAAAVRHPETKSRLQACRKVSGQLMAAFSVGRAHRVAGTNFQRMARSASASSGSPLVTPSIWWGQMVQ